MASSSSAAPESASGSTASGGGFTLSAPVGAFPAGNAVTISPDPSAPIPPSALVIGAAPSVTIATQTEPVTAVTLSATYAPESIPAGVKPLLASYSEPIGLWLPVGTTANPDGKQLTAQVPHLSTWAPMLSGVGSVLGGVATTITASVIDGAVAIDNGIVAGINTVTNDAGNGLGWLSYQINKWAFGVRTDPPKCGGLPSWVQAPIQTTNSDGGDQNAFLYACGQVGASDSLQLVVVNNRPYAVELGLPEVPTAVSMTPSSGAPFGGAVDVLLGDSWRTMSAGRRLYLPPLSTTAVDLPQPQEDVAVGSWQLSGEYNPALVLGSMLLNQALGRVIDEGLRGLPGGDTVLSQVTSCVAQSVGQPAVLDSSSGTPGPSLNDVVGALRDCLAKGASGSLETITNAAAETLKNGGSLDKSEAAIAQQAHEFEGRLGALATAQEAYELGGFTIESALAQAGQLAPIGITYTPKPNATAAATLEPNSPYRTGAADSAVFTTPSGNISCYLRPDVGESRVGNYSAACQVKEHNWSPDPRPDYSVCPDNQSWAENFVAITEDGITAGICTGDSPVASAREVLPYGESVTTGGVTCSSAEDGVSCTDSSLGKGFKVNRSSLERTGGTPDWKRQASAPVAGIDAYVAYWESKFTRVTINADSTGTFEFAVPCCQSAQFPLSVVVHEDGTATGTVTGEGVKVGDVQADLAVGAKVDMRFKAGREGEVLLVHSDLNPPGVDVTICGEGQSDPDCR